MYGEKDPKSTEQAIFVCLLCECEFKSVKTVREHCGGSKHLKKELFLLQKTKDAKKYYKLKFSLFVIMLKITIVMEITL